jgi:hypothetical protein
MMAVCLILSIGVTPSGGADVAGLLCSVDNRQRCHDKGLVNQYMCSQASIAEDGCQKARFSSTYII